MSSEVSWNTHQRVVNRGHPSKAEQHKQESTRKCVTRCVQPERDFPCSRCVKGPNHSAREQKKHPNTQRHTRTTRGHKSERALRFVLLEESDWTLKQACFQGYPESAVCVQESVGSRNSAIHNAYRSSLHPSSLFEPRHRSLKVVR